MSKVYRVSMSATFFFNIKAESDEEALEWCRTHEFSDVRKATGAIEEIYDERIEDYNEDDDGLYVDLTKKDEK